MQCEWHVRCWLLADMNRHSDYVRCYPENGHGIADVRFSGDYVRFTPNSGHYSGWLVFITLANTTYRQVDFYPPIFY